MWLFLAFLSATLLGFYDVFKKQSLKNNAVIPVLFLNTLFSSLIFLYCFLFGIRPGCNRLFSMFRLKDGKCISLLY